MSTAAMQRQIDRLATTIGQIKPRPPVQCKLIGEPPDDATDEVKAAYQAELDTALAAGVFVIRLVGLKPDPINREKESTHDEPDTSPTDRAYPGHARRDEAQRPGEHQDPDGARPRRWRR